MAFRISKLHNAPRLDDLSMTEHYMHGVGVLGQRHVSSLIIIVRVADNISSIQY